MINQRQTQENIECYYSKVRNNIQNIFDLNPDVLEDLKKISNGVFGFENNSISRAYEIHLL